MGCDQLEELVVPGLLVGVLLLCSLGQNVARSGEEVKWGVVSVLRNMPNQLIYNTNILLLFQMNK